MSYKMKYSFKISEIVSNF